VRTDGDVENKAEAEQLVKYKKGNTVLHGRGKQLHEEDAAELK
jgi:hypothetical protein